MKLVLPLVLLASRRASTGAFTPLSVGASRNIRQSTPLFAVECDTVCELPTDGGFGAPVDSGPGGASVFRGSLLTDADDNSVRLGDKMGDGKSVVVFLRHLA